MPYFTIEQEKKAVAFILEACNSFGHSSSNNGSEIRNMSYVEYDDEGYVISLVDLGLKRMSIVDSSNDEEENSHSKEQPTTTMEPQHWSMPPAIGYLTRLRKLTVYHCKSLPREIVHLSESLEEIAFYFCDELDFDTLPPEFESLEQLTAFRIHGRMATVSKSTFQQRILPIHRLQNFSNLRYLYYRGGGHSTLDDESSSMNSEETREEKFRNMMFRAIGLSTPSTDANSCLIQDLMSEQVTFKNSLEILEIEGGNLTEFTVAELFSQILPQYPNLKRLILPNNKIKSLAPIIAQHTDMVPPTIRLRCFYLMGNPILDDPELSRSPSPNNVDQLPMLKQEQANLLKLLSRYEEITSLGHGITESSLCTTELLLALDLNDGGKVLLSERFKPIPLSVWPVVLERVNQRKGYYGSTNVLYHLLRNGPAIGKRYKTVKSKAPDFVPTPMTVAAAPITTIVDYYNHTQGNIDTPVIGIAPVVHFPNSSTMVVTPTTPPAMVTSRKRKISMP